MNELQKCIQVYLNIENCMTNRASLEVLKKDMEFEEIKLIVCKFDQTFLTGK